MCESLQANGAPRAPVQSGVLGRVNAVFFDCMDWYMHWKYADLKARLFANLPPAVVEIGAGTGANFRYLRSGTKVVAAEPNLHMHAALQARARRYDIAVEVHPSGAEALALADSSVDAVIASLVLCTVREPAAVVREIVRVLRPGGRFICIEHVAAPADSLTGRLQRAVQRPWRWLFDGCHTHRDTGTLLERAGFTHVSIRRFTWRSAFLPVRPQIAAICVK